MGVKNRRRYFQIDNYVPNYFGIKIRKKSIFALADFYKYLITATMKRLPVTVASVLYDR